MSRVETVELEPYVRGQRVNGLRDRKPRQFAIGDETLTVRVRESAKAQTARIIIGPRRPLEVIVPRGTNESEVDEFLEEKRSWVERKVAAAREIAARPPQLGLERGGSVWLAGEEVPIERHNGRRSIASISDGRLVVSGPDESAAGVIARWYRREARRRIEEVVSREADRLELEYGSIGIRDPRTRWGSCSRKGNLSFLAPRRGAARDPGIRRRPRALPSARAEPPEAVLALTGRGPPELAGAGALAPRAREGAPRLRPGWRSRDAGCRSVLSDGVNPNAASTTPAAGRCAAAFTRKR
jgi:predicted metal-dependent hydrolase